MLSWRWLISKNDKNNSLCSSCIKQFLAFPIKKFELSSARFPTGLAKSARQSAPITETPSEDMVKASELSKEDISTRTCLDIGVYVSSFASVQWWPYGSIHISKRASHRAKHRGRAGMKLSVDSQSQSHTSIMYLVAPSCFSHSFQQWIAGELVCTMCAFECF